MLSASLVGPVSFILCFLITDKRHVPSVFCLFVDMTNRMTLNDIIISDQAFNFNERRKSIEYWDQIFTLVEDENNFSASSSQCLAEYILSIPYNFCGSFIK